MQGYGGPQQRARDGGGSIRHAYPLSSTSTGFFAALLLVLRTLPYAFVRFLAHVLHFVVALALIGGSCVLAAIVGSAVHPGAGVAVLVAGLVVYGVLWAWWFRYFLYAVKCGHVACLTELVTRGQIGNGSESMLSYGKHTVKDRLGDIAQVYVMQSMVRGIVHEFNSGLGFVSEIMPLDLGFVSAFAGRLLRAATRYLDETIFAYSLLRRNEPLWDVCSEGIGYYFQNTREILKTSVWTMLVSAVVTILSWIVFVAIWSVVLFPLVRTLTVSHLGSIYDPSAGSGAPGDPSTAVAVLGAIFGALILTAITVRLVSEAFLHPVYLTMVMTKYLVTIQMQPLDPSYQRFFGSARAVSLRNVVSQIDATRFGRA